MQFVLFEEPRGKGRPRFRKSSGQAYTDKKTKIYEGKIKKAFKTAGGQMLPADVPVSVTVKAMFQVPKSTGMAAREKMLSREKRPMKKPDGDNILKLVMDALNGLAYKDDKQVVQCRCIKYYCSGPGALVVEVREDHGEKLEEK